MKKLTIAATSIAFLLSACGGGSSDSSTNSVTSVKVVGASLADSGTFGYKFTVQSSSGSPYLVYSERVAAAYKVASFCPAYTFLAASTAFVTNSGCTNYAVAGASVNNYDETYAGVLETVPSSVIKQLEDVGNAGFDGKELLIVGEASANDAAALTLAYIDQTFYATSDFSILLATVLSASDLATYANDPTTLGTLYMEALADKLVAAVKTNALDKGATRIAILNTLDVTLTPRFQAELGIIRNAISLDTAEGVAGLANTWIRAFNARLSANVAAYSSNIAVVDFYNNFTARMINPDRYALSNVTSTVCDEIVTGGNGPGTTSLSIPQVVGACTSYAASSMVPPYGSDGTTNWWQSYMFADDFHPTPYGHALLTDIVMNRLQAVGWY